MKKSNVRMKLYLVNYSVLFVLFVCLFVLVVVVVEVFFGLFLLMLSIVRSRDFARREVPSVVVSSKNTIQNKRIIRNKCIK